MSQKYHNHHQHQQEFKLTSNFTPFQSKLDRYRYQNQILAQKVSLLLQENKKLQINLTSTPKTGYSRTREQPLQNKNIQSFRNLKSMDKSHKFNNKSFNREYQNQHSLSKILPTRKTPFQQFSGEHSKRSPRKYPYISQAKQIIQKRKQKYENQLKSTIFHLQKKKNYEQFNPQKNYEETWNQQISHKLNYEQQRKQKTTQTVLPKVKDFQLETFADDSQKNEKLPYFFQASFGGTTDLKQQQSHSFQQRMDDKHNNFQLTQKKYHYSISNINNISNIKHQTSSLQIPSKLQDRLRSLKSHTQKDQFDIHIQHPQTQRRTRKQNKQNIQICSGKKTNSPYLQPKHRIKQQKNKLTHILQLQQQQQNKPLQPNISCTKHSFLKSVANFQQQNIFPFN